MSGATTWSLGEGDARRINALLTGFLQEAGARTTLLIDRNGQMLAAAGEPPVFDQVAFASLTAADFSANDQLARMLGEAEFGALFHQGERESLYLADVARRVILVVLFDNRTTLGLVKLRVKRTLQELNLLFLELFARGNRDVRVEAGFVGEAEDEIDRLFGTL
jgi:predicted regulator of Ras-like GTPase activity (Roadblock/LC7/MglB family)